MSVLPFKLVRLVCHGYEMAGTFQLIQGKNRQILVFAEGKDVFKSSDTEYLGFDLQRLSHIMWSHTSPKVRLTSSTNYICHFEFESTESATAFVNFIKETKEEGVTEDIRTP